jgi:hypothetical protein
MGFIFVVLFVSSSYAQNTEELVEYSHQFHPNKMESFSNPFFWSVNAECRVKLDNQSATFRALVKNQSGTVNGQPVKEGQEITMTVSDGQSITVSASGWATVEVTDLSAFPVTVTCKLI